MLLFVALAQMIASTPPEIRESLGEGMNSGRPAVIETATADLDGDGRPDTIRIEQRRSGVCLTVATAAGRRATRELGTLPLAFTLEGTSTRLALVDVDGDGSPEILAAAVSGNRGLLYVLDWSESAVEPLHSMRSGDESFAADPKAGSNAIRVARSGRIEIATGLGGSAGTRETWVWSRDTQDFVWTDTVARTDLDTASPPARPAR